MMVVSAFFLFGCADEEKVDYKAFDHLYAKALNGHNTNCGELLSTKGWSEPSSHMKEHHGASRIPHDIFDYMYDTGKKFTEIPVCDKQIEAARTATCQELVNEILDVRKKNDEAKLKEPKDKPQMIHSYYIAPSRASFCKEELIKIKF